MIAEGVLRTDMTRLNLMDQQRDLTNSVVSYFMRVIVSVLLFVCLAWNTAPTYAAGKRVAVLVGVNRYQKPSFAKLDYAEADVEAVEKELKSLGFQTTILTGSSATRDAIIETVDRVVAPLDAEDLMLVMLSGHGQQIAVQAVDGSMSEDAFYCPYDGIAGAPESLYSLSMLLDEQLIPNVGRRIVLVDACRDVPDEVGRGIQGNAMITLPEDTAILFSCRSGQRSFEHPEVSHGVFTHCLLKGLQGGAAREGKIVWSQLVSYVDWMMATGEIRKLMSDTSPQVPISAGGIPFAVLGQGNWRSTPSVPVQPKPSESNTQVFNSIGMKLQEIPSGTFLMGSPLTESGRRPDEIPHQITLSRPYYLGVYEVTQAEYDFIMQSNPSYFTKFSDGDFRLAGQLSDQLPVEQVSWADANEFCRRLSSLPAEVKAGRRYRLPTEAEWEYACRAGQTTAFPFGVSFDSNQANGDGRFPYANGVASGFLEKTTDVAMYRPNGFGLYNMSGNVSEWCQDWYDRNYYQNSPQVDPPGPATGTKRVVRGGSWFDNPILLRSSCRQAIDPAVREPFFGFRVACEIR